MWEYVAADVRIAEALNVSVDYLVLEGASADPCEGALRPPLQGLDLGERLGQLDEDDRTAVLRSVNGLLAKERLR